MPQGARQDGEKKGKQNGRQERELEIARNLKAAGDTFDKIAYATGLDIETIKRL